MTHLNRYLFDYEYGGDASKVHGFAPLYENDSLLSEKMRDVWPKVIERIAVDKQ